MRALEGKLIFLIILSWSDVTNSCANGVTRAGILVPTCIVGLLLISTLQSFAALGVSKQSIRERIWDYMESHDIADFPRPVHHRIPNFKVVFLGLLEGDQAIRFRGTAPLLCGGMDLGRARCAEAASRGPGGHVVFG